MEDNPLTIIGSLIVIYFIVGKLVIVASNKLFFIYLRILLFLPSRK